MTTLSVVIPAYNEENGIADIVNRVLSVEKDLPAAGVSNLELLVVDDGSRDKTAEIVAEMSASYPNLRLVRHVKNKGYGGALKTGFSQARGELIGFLDADGTYPPEHFPALVKAALAGSDMVVGSRMAGAESKMPLTRRVGNLFFANLVSLLSHHRITDSASGMRVFKRQVLEKVYPLPDGLNLTPVMSTRAIHEGLKVSEVPIPYSERVGRSKLSVVRDGRIFLQSIIWTVLAYNPVRIFGAVGLGGLLVALLIGVGLAIARLQGVTQLGPWGAAAVFAALVSAVIGISLFSLGSTFNYLVSLFYKQPIRQGLFGKPLFNPSIDHYFGSFGLVSLMVGLILAGVSVYLGLSGWALTRLWLYLMGSAMFVLVGMQLMIYWLLMRVLEELSQREVFAQKDLFAGLESGESLSPASLASVEAEGVTS